jgi:hypothetical protein
LWHNRYRPPDRQSFARFRRLSGNGYPPARDHRNASIAAGSERSEPKTLGETAQNRPTVAELVE